MTRIAIGSLLAVCVVMLACPMLIAGGIYVDDFKVTNNNSVVFFDNFDDGSITDWVTPRDAFVVCDQSKPPKCWLHVNRQGDYCCCAYHKISIDRPGSVEVSAWVFLPPVEEQSCYKGRCTSFTDISIHSGSTDDSCAAAVELRPNEKGYRIRVFANTYYPGRPSQTAEVVTPKPVLMPGKWAKLALRMVFDGGTAFVSLDGKDLGSVSFLPEHYAPIKQASVWGWLGDKPRSSEK